jgi:hypothetical protein
MYWKRHSQRLHDAQHRLCVAALNDVGFLGAHVVEVLDHCGVGLVFWGNVWSEGAYWGLARIITALITRCMIYNL